MANNNLFKWKRSSPLNPPREGKTGIKDWIKRVQAASDEAATEAYGGIIPGIGDAGSMQPDDQALYEAQELLDKWMQDQHVSNINLELEFKDENWSSSTKPILNAKKGPEDYGLDDTDSYSLTDAGSIVTHQKFNPVSDASLYDDTDVNYEHEVKEMFAKFMDNSSLQSSILQDLGMEKVTSKFKDPRPKMEQRHQMVKERNKERKSKLQNVRREQMMKKDAEAIARKRVMEEEKAKTAKAQSEEAAIQKEMARIRKEMEEEKFHLHEEKQRKRDILREAKQQIHIKSKAEERLRKQEEDRRMMAEDEMRKQILAEMEDKSIQEAAYNLRVLHKHFSAWYGLIVENRVKIGKARAILDWRCKLRAWNAWKAYVSYVRSNKEAQEIATAMKIRYRKEQMALNHFRLKFLRKCFIGWQLWVTEEQRKKSAELEHQKKAFKMASFLEAAATGKLWESEAKQNVETQPQNSKRGKLLSTKNNDDCVEEIFMNEGNNRKTSATNKARNCSLSVKFPGRNDKGAWIDSEKIKKNKTDYEKAIEAEKNCTCGEGKASSKEKENNIHKTPNAKKVKAQSKLDVRNNEEKPKDVCDAFEDAFSKDNISSNELKLEIQDAVDLSTRESDVGESGRSELQETNSRKSTVKSNKPVTKPVALAMEERARQREERKALLEEKRKQQDEAKLGRLRLEQEKLLAAELQLKNERLQQKRQEKRLQRERELEKKKQQEQYREACQKAERHYQQTLLKRIGLEPWKRLVQIGKLNHQISEKYNQRHLLRICISAWRNYTEDMKEQKNLTCEDFNKRMLLRRCFLAWTKYGKHFDSLEILAARHFSNTIRQKYFVTWQHFVTNERLIYWSNEEKAEEHSERRLMKSAISCWKSFIVELKEERKKEKRKNELRKKVKEWLPDFSTL